MAESVESIAVSTKRAAELVGVSERAIRSYVASGVLPVVKLPAVANGDESSRRVLISVRDLHALVERFREVNA